MNADQMKALRAPFPPDQIHKLPKPYKKDNPKGKCKECGGYHGLPAVHLDYVGHAEVTNRLLEVDPEWSWEPCAVDEHGMPLLDHFGGLWIRMTVCGTTRVGYGDAAGKQPSTTAMKEVIGDAIRNAAMRFGVALDLWSKSDAIGFASAQGYEPQRKPEDVKPVPVALTAAIESAGTVEDLQKIFEANKQHAQQIIPLLDARKQVILDAGSVG